MAQGSSAATGAHAYGEASYWDRRYQQDSGTFDWYQKYRSLSPLLDHYLRRHHRILLVGCGNSALGEDMVCDGYMEVMNIDISSVVIDAMQEKYRDEPRLIYRKMNVMDMSDFESDSFDAVIDKGTLDSLMCGHSAKQNSSLMHKEVFRVLKNNGIYIVITYGNPDYRLYLLRELSMWTIKLHVIGRSDDAPDQQSWNLTTPIPWSEDGSSLDTNVLGKNPEVHYVYVCFKDESLRRRADEDDEPDVSSPRDSQVD